MKSVGDMRRVTKHDLIQMHKYLYVASKHMSDVDLTPYYEYGVLATRIDKGLVKHWRAVNILVRCMAGGNEGGNREL